MPCLLPTAYFIVRSPYDSTVSRGAGDHVSPHVQEEDRGELSGRKGADVPEVSRQAGADARRERPGEMCGMRALLGRVSGGCDLSRGGGKRRERARRAS